MHSSLREKVAFHFSPIAQKKFISHTTKKKTTRFFFFPGVFYRHFPREMYTHSIVEQAFLSARSSSSNNSFYCPIDNDALAFDLRSIYKVQVPCPELNSIIYSLIERETMHQLIGSCSLSSFLIFFFLYSFRSQKKRIEKKNLKSSLRTSRLRLEETSARTSCDPPRCCQMIPLLSIFSSFFFLSRGDPQRVSH